MIFWAYCNVWYQKSLLKLTHGYLTFAVIMWILVAINLVWIWGWLIGGIVFLALFGGIIIVTNFTTNQLLRILKVSPDVALAVFGVLIWILGIATVVKIFI